MTKFSPDQTEQELGEGLMLLICISESTDSQYLSKWHQSLQDNIHSLARTIHHLQNAGVVSASAPPFNISQIGGANRKTGS